MKKNRRNTRPTLERLEKRELMYAASGNTWSHPERVTFSFMPDGTTIDGSHTSNLFATMPSGWQQKVEGAFAKWAAVTNIQFALVPDSGRPEASASLPFEGDNSDGDIRIGGFNFGSGGFLDAAGETSYPDSAAGSGAGDVFFNTALDWTASGYSLDQVALHEVGHAAIGLAHSSVTTAVMYYLYNSQTTLQSDDIAGAQAAYGTPTLDRDYSYSTLSLTGNTAAAQGTISDISDLDGFQVTVPTGTNGTMTIQLQSTAFSLLEPLVAVYDSSSTLVGSAVSTNFGDTVSVKLTGLTAGGVYRIIVGSDASAAGAGANGAYGLSVRFGSTPNVKAGAAAVGSDVELAAAVGSDGGIRAAAFHTATDTATWYNVGAPSGVTFPSDPQVVASSSNFPGGIWAKGSDGNAYFNGWSGSGFWGWSSVGHPTTGIAGDLTVLANAGLGGVYVYAIGNDGHLYERWTPDATTWYGWADLGNAGATLTGNPTGWADASNNQYVWARDTNGDLTQNWYSPTTNTWYHANLGHGSATLAGSPSAAPGALEIFCVDVNGDSEIFLYTSSWAIGSLGNPGVALVNDPSTSPIAGQYNAYFLGVDGNLYERYYSGSWYWATLGSPHGGFVGSPTAVTVGSATTIYAPGADGQLYINRWTGSAWISNQSIGDGNSMLGGNPFVLPNTYVAGGGSPTQTAFETIASTRTIAPVVPESHRPAVQVTPDLPKGPLAAFPLTPARRIRQALETGRRFIV